MREMDSLTVGSLKSRTQVWVGLVPPEIGREGPFLAPVPALVLLTALGDPWLVAASPRPCWDLSLGLWVLSLLEHQSLGLGPPKSSLACLALVTSSKPIARTPG